MSAKKPPDEKISNIVPFGLRMPKWLREKVEEAAAKNNRSLNAEIIATLEIGLRRHEAIFDYDDVITEIADLKELVDAKNQTIKALQQVINERDEQTQPEFLPDGYEGVPSTSDPKFFKYLAEERKKLEAVQQRYALLFSKFEASEVKGMLETMDRFNANFNEIRAAGIPLEQVFPKDAKSAEDDK